MRELKFKQDDRVLIKIGGLKGRFGTVKSVIPHDGIKYPNYVLADGEEKTQLYGDEELELIEKANRKIDPAKAVVFAIILFLIIAYSCLATYQETERQIIEIDSSKAELLSDTVGKIPAQEIDTLRRFKTK